MNHLQEIDIETLIEDVFEWLNADWDWLGYKVDDRLIYAAKRRLADAIQERLGEVHDEYLKKLETDLAEANSELQRLRSNGGPDAALELEIEARDKFIKAMLLSDKIGERKFQTKEEKMSETEEFTLILANNDGYPSAEVLDDAELSERDLEHLK